MRFHPTPPSARLKPKPALAPRQKRRGAREPSRAWPWRVSFPLPAHSSEQTGEGRVGVSDLIRAQLYVGCSFPVCPGFTSACPAPRHVPGSTSRPAPRRVPGFLSERGLSVAFPGFTSVPGSTSRALAFSGAKAFRQVPCLSVRSQLYVRACPGFSSRFPAVCPRALLLHQCLALR